MVDYLQRAITVFLMEPAAVSFRTFDKDEQGRFWISTDGRLLSVCRDQALWKSFQDNGKGYYQTKINGKTYYLHRLLAFTFNADEEKKSISIDDDNYEVHHCDFNRQNNDLGNLCIMTRQKHQAIHRLYNKLKSMEDI